MCFQKKNTIHQRVSHFNQIVIILAIYPGLYLNGHIIYLFGHSYRKPKKIGFSVRFRLNPHETENETENTKKTIYKTETETEKTEKKTKPKPKKGLFSKIKFLNVEKSFIYVFLFSKFYYFHTKNLLWQSILHFSCLKSKLKVFIYCNSIFTLKIRFLRKNQ